jgi:hypothetical protein
MGLKAVNTDFPKMAHLDGCLVVLQSHEEGESKSTLPSAKPGDMYPWVRCTVAVLAGKPDQDHIEGKLPIVLEDMRIADTAMLDRLREILGRYDADGTPRLAYGRVSDYTNGYKNTSFKLVDPLDGDDKLAAEFVNSETGSNAFPEKDPFAEGTRAAKAFA